MAPSSTSNHFPRTNSLLSFIWINFEGKKVGQSKLHLRSVRSDLGAHALYFVLHRDFLFPKELHFHARSVLTYSKGCANPGPTC